MIIYINEIFLTAYASYFGQIRANKSLFDFKFFKNKKMVKFVLTKESVENEVPDQLVRASGWSVA